ncbi:P-loop containing nucleoside triphosphate hydrolase protein [Naviculisporaceae sp. PSN 640]
MYSPGDSSPESDSKDAGYIMLFGMTGAGKSTFISRLTGQEVGIGHGLVSSTVNTTCYKAQFNPNTTVNLIDTPGFDDTSRSNTEILRPIAECVATLQREGKPLLGIICLQRINDVRLSGSAVRTFEVLRRICGVDNYNRILLATTMWDDLDETRREDALVRETRLHEYWGGLFNNQSETILRRDSETEEEAGRRAVRALLDKHPRGAYHPPLLIQYEMVVKDKAVEETEAGRYIRGELMLARHKRLAELQEAVDKVKREADGLRQRQHLQQPQQEDTWSQSMLALARPSLSVFQSSKPARSCLPSASSGLVYGSHDRVDSCESDTGRGEVVETRSAVSRILSGAGDLFGSMVGWFNNDTDRSENGSDGRDARPPTRSRSRSFLGK